MALPDDGKMKVCVDLPVSSHSGLSLHRYILPGLSPFDLVFPLIFLGCIELICIIALKWRKGSYR
jgi:hypothetical protein